MRKPIQYWRLSALLVASSCMALSLASNANTPEEELEAWQLAQKTEVWEPVPPVVTARPGQPPSDAIVLFDGTDLGEWESAVDGNKAPWSIDDDGAMTVAPGSGGIRTKRSFCDVQLHMEWRSPAHIRGEGQGRGNSGVFFQERYEVQVLDSYENETHPNGQAASVYKQSIPLVNASRPPGEWQTYDIIYMAPRYSENGGLIQQGTVTVLHNGVLVQNHFKIQGTTEWIGPPQVEPHGCAPIYLQDHGDKVSFRNIWIREIEEL
jgi:hypothetical protein